MDAKLQRRVQRYGWDKAAFHYERYWQAQLAPAQQRLLELAALEAGLRVLDVACGTGLVTFKAAGQVGPSGSVVAIDISDVMVHHVAERGLPNVTAARMEAESLDFPDACFDAVLCALGLMYVPDPIDALREMFRVLRPGGHATVAVWGARTCCGWAEIFPIVEAHVKTEVCPLFFHLGTGDVLQQAFTAAGFAGITAERLAAVLHYGSAEDACGAAFAGGPVALSYAHFDQHTRESAHAEYLATIAPWRAGEGYNIPGEFVVGRGVRPM